MNIITNAFVKPRRGTWRGAQIEVVSLNASMLVDHETVSDGNGSFTRRPAFRGLRIDGAECVRFRLPDGRMCAVTLTFARCSE